MVALIYFYYYKKLFSKDRQKNTVSEWPWGLVLSAYFKKLSKIPIRLIICFLNTLKRYIFLLLLSFFQQTCSCYSLYNFKKYRSFLISHFSHHRIWLSPVTLLCSIQLYDAFFFFFYKKDLWGHLDPWKDPKPYPGVIGD